jgi:tetratricopeptide (TPR) repeat protein
MHRRRRYLVVGWLWFLGTLVPMIGLVQVGGQAMADRYAYLPFVGLFIAVCWGIADAAEWRLSNAWLSVVSVTVLLLLTLATHRQVSYWSDDVSLWSHAVQVTANNAAAENMLGETLQRAGRSDDAIPYFRAATAADPLLASPHYHLGAYEQRQENLSAAMEQFQEVIALTASDTGLMANLRADTFLRMSSIYTKLDNPSEAEKCLALAARERDKLHTFESNSLR